MQSDPLQQLRDVHLPAAPSWWPPAPGWWLATLVLIALLALAVIGMRRRQRRRRPFASAQRLHKDLCAAQQAGDIAVADYLHGANDLLKRVFVHARKDAGSAPLTGSLWLAYLDGFVAGAPFTSGPGHLLSEARFAPQLAGDADPELEQLQRLIDTLLRKVQGTETGKQDPPAHD